MSFIPTLTISLWAVRMWGVGMWSRCKKKNASFYCKPKKKPWNAPGTALNLATCNQPVQLKYISRSVHAVIEGAGSKSKYFSTFPLDISHCLWVINSSIIVHKGQLLLCRRHKSLSHSLPPTMARSPSHLRPRQLVPRLEGGVMEESAHNGRK